MPDGIASAESTPFESALLREVTGLALRPGGTILTDRAVSVCGFGTGARLLDVGCGAGATVEHLQSRHGVIVAGLDCSRGLLDEALRRNPFLALTEGRAESLPYPDGTMDGIFCECVLSLLKEPRLALREFSRVLRAGGQLVLSDLYQRRDCAMQPYAMPPEDRRPGWLIRGALEELVGECGFGVLLWEDHSRYLKELAARLVFSGLSPEAFCGAECGGTPDFVSARPGYYLLVGRKGG